MTEQQNAPSAPTTGGVPADARRAALSNAIAKWVGNGWRVDTMIDDYTAVMVKGRRVNHILHLILTLVTFGLWAIVWLILALTTGETRRTVRVDDAGAVNWRS